MLNCHLIQHFTVHYLGAHLLTGNIHWKSFRRKYFHLWAANPTARLHRHKWHAGEPLDFNRTGGNIFELAAA